MAVGDHNGHDNGLELALGESVVGGVAGIDGHLTGGWIEGHAGGE